MDNVDWGAVISAIITLAGALAGIIGSHKSLSKKINDIADKMSDNK